MKHLSEVLQVLTNEGSSGGTFGNGRGTPTLMQVAAMRVQSTINLQEGSPMLPDVPIFKRSQKAGFFFFFNDAISPFVHIDAEFIFSQ